MQMIKREQWEENNTKAAFTFVDMLGRGVLRGD